MKFTKKIGVKTAVTSLCLCVLIFNSISIAIGALGLREQLTWMPVALGQVTSDSMVPMFETGDMLVLIETPYEELEVGDVVTFHQGDQLVTHQIIAESGNSFMTQGIANSKADTSLMSREDYCASLLWIVPNFGSVLDFFSGAWEISCLVAFIIVAFYGKIFLEWLFAKKERAELEKERSYAQLKNKMRLLLSLTCVSVILLTPSLTTAKYVAQINEYTMLSAGSLNFTSNYLSTDGNSYSISGWQGGDYTFELQIRGYSNDLLYNGAGNDIEYGIYVVPFSESEDGSTTYGTMGDDGDYTLGIKYDTPVLSEAVATYVFPEDVSIKYGPFMLYGNDTSKARHDFEFTVAGTDNLTVGEQIRFQIWAETAHEGQFYMTQMGDFLFTKASADDFISSAEKVITGSLITYTVKSNELEQESTSKEVIFYWNTDKLYINEFETSAYQIIVSQNSSDPDFDKDEGWIKVIMKDYTSVSLQFFIRSGYDSSDITDDDLYYTIDGISSNDTVEEEEEEIEEVIVDDDDEIIEDEITDET